MLKPAHLKLTSSTRQPAWTRPAPINSESPALVAHERNAALIANIVKLHHKGMPKTRRQKEIEQDAPLETVDRL
jgi:hypothetical protein